MQDKIDPDKENDGIVFTGGLVVKGQFHTKASGDFKKITAAKTPTLEEAKEIINKNVI